MNNACMSIRKMLYHRGRWAGGLRRGIWIQVTRHLPLRLNALQRWGRLMTDRQHTGATGVEGATARDVQ